MISSEFLSWLNVASIKEHNPNDHRALKLYLMAQRVLNRENIFMVDFDNSAAVTVFIGVPGDDGRQVVWQPQDETQDTCFCHNGKASRVPELSPIQSWARLRRTYVMLMDFFKVNKFLKSQDGGCSVQRAGDRCKVVATGMGPNCV